MIALNKGDKFGRLTVLKEVERLELPCGQKNRAYLLKCKCGKQTTVRLAHLIRGRIKSCGCLVGDRSGESGKLGLYRTWTGIKNRCKESYFESHLYHAKGIKVFTEWANSYLAFREWAIKNGYKNGLQIDRIDNSKGYFPDNCRFVEPVINANNRDNTFYIRYRGGKIAFMLLIREKNLIRNMASIRSRIKRGWSVERAFDTPIRQGNYCNNGYKYEWN
jgi:hypothetical protein